MSYSVEMIVILPCPSNEASEIAKSVPATSCHDANTFLKDLSNPPEKKTIDYTIWARTCEDLEHSDFIEALTPFFQALYFQNKFCISHHTIVIAQNQDAYGPTCYEIFNPNPFTSPTHKTPTPLKPSIKTYDLPFTFFPY